MKSIKKASSL